MSSYDDHCWLTFHGEGWAIRAIERDPLVFHLWRGYWPHLQFAAVEFEDPDWPAYCDAAVKMLEAEFMGSSPSPPDRSGPPRDDGRPRDWPPRPRLSGPRPTGPAINKRARRGVDKLRKQALKEPGDASKI